MILEKTVIKEWTDIAKNDAKRYFLKKENRETPIAEYFAKKVNSYFNTERFAERMKARGVNQEGIDARIELYNEKFWSSFHWWQKENAEHEKVLSEYAPLFKEAEEFAKTIDVSDIRDGFPCGWVTIYLKPEAKDTPLGKALRAKYDGDSYSAKVCYWSAYSIPVKFPTHGQCISFSERIARKVADFLTERGVPTGTNSYID